MINKVSFMGRETMLTKINRETVDVAKDYLCAGKVYSPEERFKAAYKTLPTTHPFVRQDANIKKEDMVIVEKSLVKKAKDVDVDFFSETAPHRFTVIG